ncbi:MAG: DUF3048 domain-containing protein [bacterium]|nr:DUF3048 domain-containing protein [bacterium]
MDLKRSQWLVAGIGGTIAIVAIVFFVVPRKEQISGAAPPPLPQVSPESSPEPSPSSTPAVVPTNPLTGESCTNSARRPLAIMLSGDAIARPLSGISDADMVFEMPVITGSITRFMAIFICRDPIEIGSIRSARHDFIPLANGFDAIYVHWGGSHFALDMLKTKAIDNIDALINPTAAFWRKESVLAPHNGFSSMTRLFKAAQFMQYRLQGNAPEYAHATSIDALAAAGMLDIGYAGAFRVRYAYDPESQTYERIRGAITERDKNTGEAVRTKNVVVMRASSKQIEGQYNDLSLEGTGEATLYRSGREFSGYWKKDAKDQKQPLLFVDPEGNNFVFVPGSIWVQVVEPYTSVQWSISD